MPSKSHAPLGLSIAAIAAVLFLHIPLLLIGLYAFTTEETAYTFPPPGLTMKWFSEAMNRTYLWNALSLSLKVASVTTLIALLMGLLAAFAVHHGKFIGKEAITFLVILPIALPGIVTGIALRSALKIMALDFSFWTIIIGHVTFCIVTVYNNIIARLRRTGFSIVEASMDLGADIFQTFRYVILPTISSAMLAGGMLAFSLSFDEVIVTTFTAGQQATLPIWILSQLSRPRDRPVTNVVALFVILITTLPILLAYRLTKQDEE